MNFLRKICDFLFQVSLRTLLGTSKRKWRFFTVSFVSPIKVLHSTLREIEPNVERIEMFIRFPIAEHEARVASKHTFRSFPGAHFAVWLFPFSIPLNARAA